MKRLLSLLILLGTLASSVSHAASTVPPGLVNAAGDLPPGGGDGDDFDED